MAVKRIFVEKRQGFFDVPAQQLRPILEHKQREKSEDKLHRLRRTSNRRKDENREGKREKQDLLPSRKNQNEHQQRIQIEHRPKVERL